MSGDTVVMPSGLKYLVIKSGTGAKPQAGQTCSVHYTGWLANGNKFDSSRDRNVPFEFQLGQGRVIKGWEEGVALMRIGDQRKYFIPPNLAWGDRGFGNRPEHRWFLTWNF